MPPSEGTAAVSPDLALALALADTADRIAMARFRAADLTSETKPDDTPVTEADRAVEQALRSALSAERPADDVLGEEYGGALPPLGRVWIIDPIDATKNYLRGVPVWATLIGLVEAGRPVLGVVSAPALGCRWWAELGGPAHARDLTGERLVRVSQVRELAQASFSCSDPQGWPPGTFAALTDATWRFRAYGDFLSYMFVAEGSVDVAAEPELSIWDVAALLPIVQAAGGRATGYDGSDPLTAGSLLATNGHLHEQARRLLGAP